VPCRAHRVGLECQGFTLLDTGVVTIVVPSQDKDLLLSVMADKQVETETSLDKKYNYDTGEQSGGFEIFFF
jgi:hypothetical protein